MRWRSCVLLPFLLVSPSVAQGVRPDENHVATSLVDPVDSTGARPATYPSGFPSACEDGRLSSNRHFSNFIGWMSNPLQNIDPRSLTQVVPLFISSWVSDSRPLPDLDGQVFGPAFSLALTDRFCVGLNQGGYAFLHLDRNDPRGPLLDRRRRHRGEEFGGTREGFLNLGGFAQYTLIQDVANQFLATAGLRVVVPCGSYEIFQGKGPALLSPYLTVGKEFHDFHLLATAGYQFPAGSGEVETDFFFLNAHLDRQCFGWVYPLVEVNWIQHTSTVDVTLPTRRGFIDFGNFESSGNLLTLAVGANFVLCRDRLEVGGAYIRGVATQRDIDIDSLIVKMVLRF